MSSKKQKIEEGMQKMDIGDVGDEDEWGDDYAEDNFDESDFSDSEDDDDSDLELMENLMATIKETRQENKILTNTLLQLTSSSKNDSPAGQKHQQQPASQAPSTAGNDNKGKHESMFAKIMALSGEGEDKKG